MGSWASDEWTAYLLRIADLVDECAIFSQVTTVETGKEILARPRR